MFPSDARPWRRLDGEFVARQREPIEGSPSVRQHLSVSDSALSVSESLVTRRLRLSSSPDLRCVLLRGCRWLPYFGRDAVPGIAGVLAGSQWRCSACAWSPVHVGRRSVERGPAFCPARRASGCRRRYGGVLVELGFRMSWPPFSSSDGVKAMYSSKTRNGDSGSSSHPRVCVATKWG